jgi:hypothetical protein
MRRCVEKLSKKTGSDRARSSRGRGFASLKNPLNPTACTCQARCQPFLTCRVKHLVSLILHFGSSFLIAIRENLTADRDESAASAL